MVVDYAFIILSIEKKVAQNFHNHLSKEKQKSVFIIQLKLFQNENFLFAVSNVSTDFPGGSDSKAPFCNAGDLGSSLGWEDPLEKEMAIRSSTIAWKIPWTEEPCRLQSMGSQRVCWATSVKISCTIGHTQIYYKSSYKITPSIFFTGFKVSVYLLTY